MGLLGIILMSICIALDTIQQLLFRTGARVPGKYWICIIPACLLYVVSLFFYFRALKFVPLVVASPLMASSYVTIALLSRILFKERVDTVRWTAILLITAGAALLSLHNP
jgi:drug/metabolite transporter (DMT)-like permease